MVPRVYHVIVVGGGGSGLAAAMAASEHGARVLLLEKTPNVGGTTGIAIGSYTANRTVYQRRAGIDDNPDDHELDASRFAPPDIETQNHTALRRFFLGHAADTLDWLMGMGLRFYGPSPEPPNRAPRMHTVVPNAKAYIATLQSRLLRLGGRIECNCPAEELLMNEGRVTGVVARWKGHLRTFVAASGVVLAAGDYANSPEMIGQYKGLQYTAIEGINPHTTGDGHRLAQRAGAQLLNMSITYGPELRFIPPPRKPFTQLLPGSGPLTQIMGKMLPLVPRVIVNSIVKRLLVTWQHPENALNAERVGRTHAGHEERTFADAFLDAAPPRIADDFDHWREQMIDAGRRRLAGNLRTHAFCELRIPGTPQGDELRIDRRAPRQHAVESVVGRTDAVGVVVVGDHSATGAGTTSTA